MGRQSLEFYINKTADLPLQRLVEEHFLVKNMKLKDLVFLNLLNISHLSHDITEILLKVALNTITLMQFGIKEIPIML
jgi:hypothetical protein